MLLYFSSIYLVFHRTQLIALTQSYCLGSTSWTESFLKYTQFQERCGSFHKVLSKVIDNFWHLLYTVGCCIKEWWDWHYDTCFELLPVMPASKMSIAHVLMLHFLTNSQQKLMEKQMEDGPIVWAPATQVEDLDEASGFCLAQPQIFWPPERWTIV